MKTKDKTIIYDYIYSLFFAGFFFISILESVLFPEGQDLKNLDEWNRLVVVFWNWLILSLILMYFWLAEFFIREGILKEKNSFRPIKFFQKNIKPIFIGFVLPVFETGLLLFLAWLMLGTKILFFMYFALGDVTIWDGFLTAMVFLALIKISTLLNARLLKTNGDKPYFFGWPLTAHYSDKDKDIIETTLGKHTNDWHMLILICVFMLGSIVALDFLYTNTILYVIIVYLVLFGYNIYYIYRKRKRILWLYCFVGALPFGFIFPAFLPQKSVLEEIK